MMLGGSQTVMRFWEAEEHFLWVVDLEAVLILTAAQTMVRYWFAELAGMLMEGGRPHPEFHA